MTWGWTGVRGTWAVPEAARSMDVMVEGLGTPGTAVAVTGAAGTPHSPALHLGASALLPHS